MVDHQPVECSVPEKNPRICAPTSSTTARVKRVRVYFRSDRQDAYYWSEMAFDGIQFCATLPVAKGRREGTSTTTCGRSTTSFRSRATRSQYEISMRETTSCSYPVIDEDPERIASLVVNATSEKQGDEIKDFEEESVANVRPYQEEVDSSWSLCTSRPRERLASSPTVCRFSSPAKDEGPTIA